MTIWKGLRINEIDQVDGENGTMRPKMEKGKRPKVRREDIGGKIEKERALQIY